VLCLSVDADGHYVLGAATANSTRACRLCGRGYYDLDPGPAEDTRRTRRALAESL